MKTIAVFGGSGGLGNKLVPLLKKDFNVISLGSINLDITSLYDVETIDNIIEDNIIKDNINLLVTSFYQFNNPVLHYGNILDYADVNAMEENLKITNDLISALILELRLCGYTTCGEDINL